MSHANDAHPVDSPSTGTPKPELLTALPDVPTLSILSLLPLRQLIVNLPLVHRRLAPFCKSVLKVTKRLVLHIGDQRWIQKRTSTSPLRLPFASHLVDSTGALLYPETDFSTLHLETLDEHSIEQLTSLLPAIVHLQVAISHIPMALLPQLTLLLVHRAPALQSLTLSIGQLHCDPSNRKSIYPIFHHLIDEINSKLVALQTLSLDFSSEVHLHYDEFIKGGSTGAGPLCLSILGQLRQFNLHLGKWARAPRFLLEQLEAYASEKLTSIGLAGDYCWNWKGMANSAFAGRFTRVPFKRIPIDSPNPHLPSFSNLTVYGFNWKGLSALELVSHLHFLSSSFSHLQCFSVLLFSPAPALHPPLALFTDFPSLRWVTVLEITSVLNDSENHNYLLAPYWSTLFPSVQILKVNHLGYFCSLCYPDEDRFARNKIPDYDEVMPCLRQLFAPLAVLPSLRKIFYQRGDRFDLIAEFTPQGEFVRTHEYIG